MAEVGRNDYVIGGDVTAFNKSVDTAITKIGEFFDNIAALSDEIDQFAARAGQKFSAVASALEQGTTKTAQAAASGIAALDEKTQATLDVIASGLTVVAAYVTKQEALAASEKAVADAAALQAKAIRATKDAFIASGGSEEAAKKRYVEIAGALDEEAAKAAIAAAQAQVLDQSFKRASSGGTVSFADLMVNLKDQLQDANDSLEKTRIVLNTAADAFRAIQEVGRDIARFFKEGADESDAFAERMVRLETAMDNAGFGGTRAKARFVDFLNGLEETTRFTNDELASAAAIITQNFAEMAESAGANARLLGQDIAVLGPEARQSAVEFLNLAAVGITVGNKLANLDVAANAVAKAIAGDNAELARLVPAIKNSPELLADTGKALEFLVERAGKGPDKTQLQQFTTATENLRQAIGEAITPARDFFLGVLQKAGLVLKALADDAVGRVVLQLTLGTITIVAFAEGIAAIGRNVLAATQGLKIFGALFTILFGLKKADKDATDKNALATGVNTAAQVANTSARQANIAVQGAQAAALGVNTAAQLAEAEAKSVAVIAGAAATAGAISATAGATAGGAAATGGALASISAAVPPILAVVAALAALVVGYKLLRPLFQSTADETDDLTKSTEENAASLVLVRGALNDYINLTPDAIAAQQKLIEEIARAFPIATVPGLVKRSLDLTAVELERRRGEFERLFAQVLGDPAKTQQQLDEALAITQDTTAIDSATKGLSAAAQNAVTSITTSVQYAVTRIRGGIEGFIIDAGNSLRVVMDNVITTLGRRISELLTSAIPTAEIKLNLQTTAKVVTDEIEKAADKIAKKLDTAKRGFVTASIDVLAKLTGKRKEMIEAELFGEAAGPKKPEQTAAKPPTAEETQISNLREKLAKEQANLKASVDEIINAFLTQGERQLLEGSDAALTKVRELTLELKRAGVSAKDLGGAKFGHLIDQQATLLANQSATEKGRQQAAQIISGQVSVLRDLVDLGELDLSTARARLVEHLNTLRANRNMATQINEIANVERGIAEIDQQRARNAATRLALGGRDLAQMREERAHQAAIVADLIARGAPEEKISEAKRTLLESDRAALEVAREMLTLGDPLLEDARRLEEEVRARVAGTEAEVALRREFVQAAEEEITATTRLNQVGTLGTDDALKHLAISAQSAKQKGILLDIEGKLAEAVISTASHQIEVSGNTAESRAQAEKALVAALGLRDVFGFIPTSIKKIEAALVGVFQKESEIGVATILARGSTEAAVDSTVKRINAEADVLQSVDATRDAYESLATITEDALRAVEQKGNEERKSPDQIAAQKAPLVALRDLLLELADLAPKVQLTPREQRRGEAKIRLQQAIEEAQDPFAGFFDRIGTEAINFSGRLADGLASEMFRAFEETGRFAKAQFGKIFRQIGLDFGRLVIQKIMQELAALLVSAIVKLFISIFSGGAAGGGGGGVASIFGYVLGGNKQHGFSGVVNRPTTMTFGEAGAERIDITPAGRVVPLAEEIGSGVFSALASRLNGLIESASVSIGAGNGLVPSLAGANVTIIVSEPSPLTQVRFVDDVVAKRMDQRSKDLRKGSPRPLKNPTVRR